MTKERAMPDEVWVQPWDDKIENPTVYTKREYSYGCTRYIRADLVNRPAEPTIEPMYYPCEDRTAHIQAVEYLRKKIAELTAGDKCVTIKREDLEAMRNPKPPKRGQKYHGLYEEGYNQAIDDLLNT